MENIFKSYFGQLLLQDVAEYTYPDSYLPHPNIGHIDVLDKVMPLIKQKMVSFDDYLKLYQITYTILCLDFENYLKWRELEFWIELKNKNKRMHK